MAHDRPAVPPARSLQAPTTALSSLRRFILVPAVGCYGRIWEKIAAGFLTLFMLATLVGIGVGIGVGGLYLWIQGA